MPPLAISVEAEPAQPEQGRRRGNAPVGELARRARAPAPSARSASTLTHDVPPAPETSTVRTPDVAQPLGRRAREMPQPVSFATTGTRQLAHEPRERREPAAEVAIAARLDQLLRRVQVEADRVGADARARAARPRPSACAAACTSPRLASTSVVGACARTAKV